MNLVNSAIVKFVETLPKSVVRHFANKYIAGDKVEDAVRVTKELNAKGILTTIDVLGEAVTTKEEAISAKNECLQVLEMIEKHKLNSNLSVKPTQLGLLLNEDFCYFQIAELAEKAKSIGSFVRLDMEDSTTTTMIINLFKNLRKQYSNVGVVLQSYLHRTQDDVKQLTELQANFRLCKGIYIESPEIAYKDRQKIRDNYIESLEVMFDRGAYVGIATHDPYLVDEAKKLIARKAIDKSRYEFQMLLGVAENLRDRINAEGEKIRIYTPFGKDWYLYSMRRLKENPNIAGQITKNVFGLN